VCRLRTQNNHIHDTAPAAAPTGLQTTAPIKQVTDFPVSILRLTLRWKPGLRTIHLHCMRSAPPRSPPTATVGTLSMNPTLARWHQLLKGRMTQPWFVECAASAGGPPTKAPWRRSLGSPLRASGTEPPLPAQWGVSESQIASGRVAGDVQRSLEGVISDSQEALQQLILEAIAELQVVASATAASDEPQGAGGPPGEERRASEAWLAAESIMSGARRSSERIVAKAQLAAEGVLRDALVASERVVARSDQAAEEIAEDSLELTQRISSNWPRLTTVTNFADARYYCQQIHDRASTACSAAVTLICSVQEPGVRSACSAQESQVRDVRARQLELARAVSEQCGWWPRQSWMRQRRPRSGSCSVRSAPRKRWWVRRSTR
jgi:hypothetical protein